MRELLNQLVGEVKEDEATSVEIQGTESSLINQQGAQSRIPVWQLFHCNYFLIVFPPVLFHVQYIPSGSSKAAVDFINANTNFVEGAQVNLCAHYQGPHSTIPVITTFTPGSAGI